MIASAILARSDELRRDYQSAKPFRHLCLDGFLEPQVAAALLREFPAFDPEFAKDEMGRVGGKAVHTDLKSLGPAYRRLYDYMRTPAFLGSMSDMLGVPDLLFDPAMYGGGTHENLEGQELDPHVDFNYDPRLGLHRRLNLLIYLNTEWDLSWGGGIELHSDPRDWDGDQVTTFNCAFNRGVIFETNEHSWHGFSRIRLPADKRGLSRKCISVYLYTRRRPRDEQAPPHGTFYVQRPLPKRITVGHALTAGDLEEIRRLLTFRDGWIRFYQQRELEEAWERQSLLRYAGSQGRRLLRRVWRVVGRVFSR